MVEFYGTPMGNPYVRPILNGYLWVGYTCLGYLFFPRLFGVSLGRRAWRWNWMRKSPAATTLTKWKLPRCEKSEETRHRSAGCFLHPKSSLTPPDLNLGIQNCVKVNGIPGYETFLKSDSKRWKHFCHVKLANLSNGFEAILHCAWNPGD